MAAAGFERFLDELECPVCLLVPRDIPVPACPAGHILCRGCRDYVESCPTCRRPMSGDGTNTLANKMIEEISHSCKYSQFGCKIKHRLNELMEHESKCSDRTIKCPHLNCNEEVQIKKYYDHALNSNCNRSISINGKSAITTLIIRSGENIQSLISRDAHGRMKGFEKSDRGNHVGDVRLRQPWVDITEKVEMCVDCKRYFLGKDSLQKHLEEVHKLPNPGQTNDVSNSSSSSTSKKKRRDVFYLHNYYFSTEKTFAFYVTGEEERYLAKMTLKNFNDERKFLTSVQSVVSMDSAPRNKYEVLASKNVMFIPWRQMSGLLKWTEKDGKQSSKIQTTVEIIDD